MPELSEKIRAILRSLPHKPGIYLHKDAAGNVLYVGKATSLHSRVRSYFTDPADLSPKNQALVAKIADIEYIVVGSEVEALILENEYIKRYQPKYNVRLRDDKNYPYIKVALTEDFPRIYRVRSFRRDGNRYFGPYTNSGAVDATLDLMNKLFPFRTCKYDATSWAPPRGTEADPPATWKGKLLPRPCTQYYIHRCGAPCVGFVNREQYDAVIRQAILFLEGKHDEVLRELQAQMDSAAENLEFERAAALRDRVKAVEQVLEKQKVISTTNAGDQDVIALASEDDETCAMAFFFRGGKLVGREYFMLRGTRDTPAGEIMGTFLVQFYDQAPLIPPDIILSVEPDSPDALREWLREKRSGAVTLAVPQRGDRMRLIEMVSQNASEVLAQQRIKWLSDTQKTAFALEQLQSAFNLSAPPHRIECYDISNIQGTNVVGAMVVFENGKPVPAEYRRFRIKTVEGQNDVGSIQEVLRRRFRRMQIATDGNGAAPDAERLAASAGVSPADTDEDEAAEAEAPNGWASQPDLVVVDGGRPQLNAALAVFAELSIEIPVVGIAKEDHGAIGTYEEFHMAGQAEPLVLDRGSQGLYLMQRVRDEAHRFAITYHRQIRSKRSFKSVLDDVPGIGPKRKKALLKHFGSTKAIGAASAEEIAAALGISPDLAARIKEHIGGGHAIAVE